jgi:hypothetical protein
MEQYHDPALWWDVLQISRVVEQPSKQKAALCRTASWDQAFSSQPHGILCNMYASGG